MKLIALLKAYRAQEGLSIREAAKLIGLAPATLHRFESGHSIYAQSWSKILTWLFSE